MALTQLTQESSPQPLPLPPNPCPSSPQLSTADGFWWDASEDLSSLGEMVTGSLTRSSQYMDNTKWTAILWGGLWEQEEEQVDLGVERDQNA